MIVYRIVHKESQKTYVGQTIRTLSVRLKQHLNRKECVAISGAIKKYGIESFMAEQIDSADSIQELNKKETYWIEKLNTLSPNGYNLTTGGDGKKFSEETKRKMSARRLGKKLSESHKKNIGASLRLGRQKYPEKFKKGTEAMVLWLKQQRSVGYCPKRGKKVSEEGRRKIAEAKIGSKNPMFGNRISEDQKKILREARVEQIKILPFVICHQTMKVYKTVTDAAKDLGFARSSVSNVLTGFRKSCRGYTFEYLPREITHEQP